jgi:hypothetical protein
MTTRRRAASAAPRRDSAVWIDQDKAVITQGGQDESQTVEVLVRGPSEDEALFDIRTIDEVLDRQRVVVSGPPDKRLEFERAYVALTHRPDRLTDDEQAVAVPREARQTI